MKVRLGVTVFTALLLAGCSPSAPTAGDTPATSGSPTAATSRPLPPVPGDADEPTPTKSSRSGCHTVTSAAGLPLAVAIGHTTIPCAQATDVVAAFHAQITGRQPPGSDRPAGAEVDGWHCVSGPPSAQGGTTCDRGSDEIMAAVVDRE